MAINSSQKFKPNTNKLTEFRIKLIMKYFSYCYLEMVNEKKTYDFNRKGKVNQENFLRNGFVDDYLSQAKFKKFYKSNISDNPNVEIYFAKEENQVYDFEGELANDFIDISIRETKLSEILSSTTGNEIKFAVECKRINNTKDCKEYIKDIQKFADRSFTTYKLPYEGQIGFIENDLLDHVSVSSEVNSQLKSYTKIKTVKLLEILNIYDPFTGGYISNHNRNHGSKAGFFIFHLFFDYSKIIKKTIL